MTVERMDVSLVSKTHARKKPWSKAWRQDLSKKISFNKTELQNQLKN
jgi:hypothetical protein